jgi:general secretion pathway protein G
MKKNKLSMNSGFTLIELLIVIAVISMVMVVLYPNFMGARQRARDSQRKSDLAQIQKALELYKLDQATPAYPAALPTCGVSWIAGNNLYMRKVPCDPGSTNPTPYVYQGNAGGDVLRYNISACLENPADPDRDPTPVSIPGCLGTSYTLHEP